MRLARGPFRLGSISKLTRSPPASESKFTLESRPVLWKKYSFPSSAAMKPNPRSETSFLMVPVGIDQSPLLESQSRRGDWSMPTGTIKKLVSDRGFGFIAAEDGKEYFFHRTGLDSSVNYDSLAGGARVSFEIEPSQKGPRANRIKLA